jgi:hypothetical protein
LDRKGLLPFVVGVLCLLGGCLNQAQIPIEQESREPVASTFTKAAIRVFSSDHVGYDVLVTKEFSGQELETLQENLPSLVTMIETALGSQNSIWGAKLAGHFKVQKVIPLLRHHLLTPRRCYGWEGPDYSKLESYLADYQYQYSITYLQAIEKISGMSIRNAVKLNPAEAEVIDRHARNQESKYYHWALWMRRKFNLR